MSDLERIVVLAGGLSPEREVSLRSGDRDRDALDEAGIHAVVADADSALLDAAGADTEHLETGCCGLAGDFGFQQGHGEVSRAIAVRAAGGVPLLEGLRGEQRHLTVLKAAEPDREVA